MKVYLLSQRGWLSSVSHDPLYELEDLIARACDGVVLAPRARHLFEKASSVGAPTQQRILKALVRRTMGPFERVVLPPKTGPELLICVGIASYDLEIVQAVPSYRDRFDLIVGYVFDAWRDYPELARGFDRVFVPLPDEIHEWKKRLGVEARLLPFGVDALVEGGGEADRPIDLLSYGRIPPTYRDAFASAFNEQKSGRLFLRTEARTPVTFTRGPLDRRSDHADVQLLYRLLRRSKTSLCFDTLYPGMRRFPYSFVTLRWFDAFATGCAVVGKRPITPEADRLMDWRDATIELPEEPYVAVEMLEALFDDAPRLERIRLRNHFEALARHDWRLRVRDMFADLGIALPSGLRGELDQLAERADAARRKALAVGAFF